jgi:hypothetical protein
MRLARSVGELACFGMRRDSAGFTFGRFGPRIAPTTVELALLSLADFQSRSATLEPRRF